MSVEAPTYDTAKDWKWTETLDPAESILTVYAQNQLITLDHEDENGDFVAGNKPKREVLARGTTPYSPPTTFREVCALFAMPNLHYLGVADWQFIGSTDADAKTTAFHFFKNKTAAELATPNESNRETGSHYWPAVLKAIYSETDYSTTRSYNVIDPKSELQGIVTAPVVMIRDILINAIKEGSIIITELYLSATQPAFRYDPCPQPQPVVVRVNGEQKQYDEVLHDDLRFEATPSGTRQFLTNGSTSEIGGAVGEQRYPRTGKFPDWKPYTVARSPKRNQYGLWETQVIKVRPPKRRTTQG